MRARRLAGIGVAVLIVLVFGTVLSIDKVMYEFAGCRVVRLTSVASPDGSKSVVTFRKECGATVADSTHASIVAARSSLEDAPPFLSASGDLDILATWSGEHLVRMGIIPGTDRFYKRELRAGDVSIAYE